MSLRSDFRNLLFLDPFRPDPLIILVLFLQIIWIVVLTRPNSRHTSTLFFIFYFSYHFNFSFDAQNFPFIPDYSHVITLPVSC